MFCVRVGLLGEGGAFVASRRVRHRRGGTFAIRGAGARGGSRAAPRERGDTHHRHENLSEGKSRGRGAGE